ncbi:dTDP-4-dehydrorhamnose 3,5-epimerase [Limnobacter sp.]|uniref:dTDP-4-dehydrorhamnose 3,5-epimerase n=1 Tax=Limnobacter sp. TaxID=2003368 RepID=UPI003519CE8D
MICQKTPLEGLLLLQPTVHADARGHFFESFNARVFEQLTGLKPAFVQTNESLSHRGVLRGLHWQVKPCEQGKLVRVVHGCVFDVAVDLRPTSSTFGQWYGCELNDTNHHQLWIPPGFAHGFLALSSTAITSYQVTAHHSAPHERSLKWDDPDLRIQWPLQAAGVEQPVLSAKDAGAAAWATMVRSRQF